MLENSCFKFRDKKIFLGKKTYVMGILNVTPDSFSDGGKHLSLESAVKSALEMEIQGADFIDIGGQSTRPGSNPIPPEEEWMRIKDVLSELTKKLKIPISVDTFYPEVADLSLTTGCHIINDVSGRINPKMAETVKKYSAGWILMHNSSLISDDVCGEVKSGLKGLFNKAVELGIEKERICLDPGIGFGKNNLQNLELIAGTKDVKQKNVPYLLALSRKRCVDYCLGGGTTPDMRDPGTTVLNTVGIMGGADIIRVHNVPFAVQCAKVLNNLSRSKDNE